MSWITSGSELCNSVSQFLQNCSTPFSSSQSGKANDESASTGGRKPTPASPKGDRRSVLSEKEIQDSDNCLQLRMGCFIAFIPSPFIFMLLQSCGTAQ